MSFLNSNNSEFLSARITNRGRKAIAKGNFKIEYFQIGDSEYDYTSPFNNLTGTTGQQKVFAPFDYESGVKNPFGLDSTISTTYGHPISNSETIKLRNEMGAAGFVSQYDIFGPSTKTLIPNTGATFTETYSGTTVKNVIGSIPYSGLTGTNQITFIKNLETNFNPTGYTTLVFKTLLTGNTLDVDGNKVIENYIPTGKTNSLVYRYSGGTTGTTQTITLDRNVPNLSTISGLTGNVQIITNDYNGETLTGNLIYPIDYTNQLNSWKLNTVWSDLPIGGKDSDETLTGYTGNQYISIKNFLGYTKTGQTFSGLNKLNIQFSDPIFTGSTYSGFSSTNIGTGFANSFNELIEVLPSEQRLITVIHYSELGNITVDPERFFKYDDYIGHCTTTGINECNVSLFNGLDSEDRDYNKSDSDYFEIYIPFIYYHRKNTNTLGALFTMDTTDYYMRPLSDTTGSRFELKYRYLLDEDGFIVGKVFVNNKIIVFDDQELVTVLDYRSNRRFTLPAPKLGLTQSDGISELTMLSTTGSTAWITYMFEDTNNKIFNSFPCNYFNKINSNGTPSQLTFKFSGNSFANMSNSLTGNTNVTNSFVANKFYALTQITDVNSKPNPGLWKKIDITSQIPNYSSGYINPTGLTGVSFTISYSDYSVATNFDFETHLTGVTTNYLGTSGSTDYSVTIPQFGDEQPFPGSIRLVRASDIEQMNMMINLPSTQFTKTQNPTKYNLDGTEKSGDKYITEVALLDYNKEPLVVAKTPTPVKRTGTQVFSIKLDF